MREGEILNVIRFAKVIQRIWAERIWEGARVRSRQASIVHSPTAGPSKNSLAVSGRHHASYLLQISMSNMSYDLLYPNFADSRDIILSFILKL